MRVLLVNANRKADLLAAAPIGLCYVATATRQAGHDVRVLDLCFAGSRALAHLRSAVRTFRPETVGFSVRNVDNVNLLRPVSYLPGVANLVAEVRRYCDSPIVLGGSAISLMPEAALRAAGADIVVVSDGERSFLALLEAQAAGAHPKGIPGVGFLDRGGYRQTAPEYPAFDVPAPDLGRWIDLAPYERLGGSYGIQTKRGCPRACVYCTYNARLEGSLLRLRDAREVVDEMEEAVHRYHPRMFEIVDSVFNDPPDHARAILEEILRRAWTTRLTAMGVHPLHLDHDLLELMWRAGFRSFMITPESASDPVLRRYRKGFGREQVVRAAEAIARTSFSVWWSFLLGGPGETHATLQESLDFCRRHLHGSTTGAARHVAQLFFGVRLYPGTDLWQQASEEGLIRTDADPLQQLWYVSRDLNLRRALAQMEAAAAESPEILLGYDEGYLTFSRMAAAACRLFGRRPPFWRHARDLNALALRAHLRFLVRPDGMAPRVETTLRRQCPSRPQTPAS
jgi:radical SAM superfamily enzyme YgiQ (UPF0313 family)